MKIPNDFRVIAVKDNFDVIKAARIFSKIGIKILSKYKSEEDFLKNGKDIENNFLIYGKMNSNDKKNYWRIQSHFITNGISIEELEKRSMTCLLNIQIE